MTPTELDACERLTERLDYCAAIEMRANREELPDAYWLKDMRAGWLTNDGDRFQRARSILAERGLLA